MCAFRMSCFDQDVIVSWPRRVDEKLGAKGKNTGKLQSGRCGKRLGRHERAAVEVYPLQGQRTLDEHSPGLGFFCSRYAVL